MYSESGNFKFVIYKGSYVASSYARQKAIQKYNQFTDVMDTILGCYKLFISTYLIPEVLQYLK